MARKFAISTTLIILTLVLILEQMGYRGAIGALEGSMESRVTATGALVAALTSEAISMNFFSFLQEEMTTLKKENPDILHAFIVNAEKEVMAHTDETKVMTQFKGALVNEVELAWEKHALIYKVPIVLGVQATSNFIISVKTDALEDSKKKLLWQSLMKILGIAGFGILLSFWLGKKFVNPIVLLSKNAENLALGNLEQPIETGYTDELGSLAQSFEEMRCSLKTRYDEILTLNKTLDAKVVERTESLRRTLVEVETAKTKITDSIHYATKIQKALLPDEQKIQHLFQGFFSLWKPRDEVGGDIYLVEQMGSSTVIILIDCTGHGVPGALMTMIAISALQRILIDEKCLEPSEILQRLNVFIKNTLKQHSKDSPSDDGLEAAVCVYHSQHKEMSFASARLSLFQVIHGVVTRIKGDRKSIGYRRSPMNIKFKTHRIPINRETSFYLVSDGYFEQAGGSRGLPFGYIRLSKLFKNIQHLSFHEQKTFIGTEFDQYRGKNEAQDDVTVLGFKIKA